MALSYKVWALSDPHLSFGIPNKSMEVFGPLWANYTQRMEAAWRALIREEDLVLIPGDISWAMRLEEAMADLNWIAALPGTKVIIKGNHDFWWGSASKLAKALPPTMHFIQNNAFNWNAITIGGSRLWDSDEYRFNQFVQYQENPRAREEMEEKKNPLIFERELQRLKLSLEQLNPKAEIRIAMTHYPPIGADLKPSRASQILEEYKISICVFGHLHSIKKDLPLFGEARGVRYLLTSCDYLDFTPLQIL